MKKIKMSEVIINHLLQFFFIFSSVYFAFWLTNYGEEKRIIKIQKKAIELVYKELQENVSQLEVSLEYHTEMRNKLFAYADSIEKGKIDPQSMKPISHLARIFSRQANVLGLPNLNRDAWEMLQSSEAYVTLDYELSSEIGKLYRIQSIGVEQTAQKISDDIFNSKSRFLPQESEAIILLTAWSFRELTGQEQYLLKKSQEILIQIEDYYPQL